jgi:acetylornithine/succinyldiaminopimelate/putrescine aminotransferase
MSLLELPAYARLAVDVEAADGCELTLTDGRRLLDLYGGHCVNSLGAGDAGLGARLASQWSRLSFTTNLLETQARERFLRAFEPLLPPADWRVFLTNSGAEANENALKLALAATGRERVLCFDGAFHGRTAAAAAVSDGASSGFPRAPFDVVRVPFGVVPEVDGTFGAVVVEPIQSLAGVVDPPPGFLATLREACRAADVPLIFDEVQTGSGRLGVPFAMQHFDVVPDVVTTAKGAGGGFPIGVTVVRAELAARAPDGLFGSTFGGGPLALAAATEVAQRVAQPAFQRNVQEVAAILARCAGTGPVTNVRGAGLLLGLEVDRGTTARALRDELLGAGILTGLCRDPQVLRLSPPLTLTPAQAVRLPKTLAGMEVAP